MWTSNPKVADVYVNNTHQMNVFGKEAGEATVIATAADGSVVYGAKVQVNQNISSINQILQQAMPGSDISVQTVGQVAVINGTVASPDDAAQAEMLVKAALNPGITWFGWTVPTGLEIFVDANNGQTRTYQADDAQYRRRIGVLRLAFGSTKGFALRP